MRAGGGADSPAEGALSRRADDRLGRLDAVGHPKLHQAVQRAIRRHLDVDQPLHGRCRGALPTGDRHRQGTTVLRRLARRFGAANPAGKARGADTRASHRQKRASGPRQSRLGRSRRRRASGSAGGGERHGEPGAGAPAGQGSHGGEPAARRGDERAVLAHPSGARRRDQRGSGGCGMSLAKSVRALPTLFKVGFLEAVAYRAELLVWVLSTTMPLIMLALWSAVAREAPVGRFGQMDFVAYFLATFIVRQLTGAWVAWEMNWEVRQ